MEFVRATVDLASVAASITAPILLLALHSAAVMAVFSPVSRFSRWFDFCYFFFGIFAFIPGLHFWCCLSCSACLFSSSLALGVFPAGHLLWWSLPICLGFLSITAVLCLLPLLLLGVG